MPAPLRATDREKKLQNFRESYPHLSQFLRSLSWDADGSPNPHIHPSLFPFLASPQHGQDAVRTMQNEFLAQVGAHLQMPGLDFVNDGKLRPIAGFLNDKLRENMFGLEDIEGGGIIWQYLLDKLPRPLDDLDFPRCSDMVLDAMLQLSVHSHLFQNVCPGELALCAPADTDPAAREAQALQVVEIVHEAYMLGCIRSPRGSKSLANKRQHINRHAPTSGQSRNHALSPPPSLPALKLASPSELTSSPERFSAALPNRDSMDSVDGMENQVLHRLAVELGKLRKEVTELVHGENGSGEILAEVDMSRARPSQSKSLREDSAVPLAHPHRSQQRDSEYPDPDGLSFADLVDFDQEELERGSDKV